MEKPSEEIQTLNYLIQSLGNQVNESSNQITSLQQSARGLVSSGDYESLIQKGPEVESGSNESDVNRLEEDGESIQDLEKERIQLVMDIQKQDFITEKLLELNEQNSGIVESFQEFVQHRNQMRKDDEANENDRLKYFNESVMDPKISLLDVNIKEMNHAVQKLELYYKSLSEEIAQENKKILSDDYQKNLKILISNLNAVFNRYVTSDPTLQNEKI